MNTNVENCQYHLAGCHLPYTGSNLIVWVAIAAAIILVGALTFTLARVGRD